MPNPLDSVEIRNTGVRVTRVGLGGAPLGGLFADVGIEAAATTVLKAHELGVRYFDTAPLYGSGRSELAYAEALRQLDRNEFVISTKVGRVLVPVENPPESEQFMNLPAMEPVFDFSRDGVLRSLEDSLERLALDRIDIALIHDPDDHYQQAIGEAYPVLADLRSQGVIRAIGAGMNQWQMLADLAREGDFDCFLLAGRYTLLDPSGLAELLPLCAEKGIGIILGGPYNSGILASDLSSSVTYDYMAAPPGILAQARSMKAVCDRYDVPLKAAALQFGLAHPAVVSTIPGARSIDEVAENLEMAVFHIPADLWAELCDEGLIPHEAPTQAGP
jgi:D-threo-aldose 1-dehydrogenase